MWYIGTCISKSYFQHVYIYALIYLLHTYDLIVLLETTKLNTLQNQVTSHKEDFVSQKRIITLSECRNNKWTLDK